MDSSTLQPSVFIQRPDTYSNDDHVIGQYQLGLSSTTVVLGLELTLTSSSATIDSISKTTISTVILSHSTEGSDFLGDGKSESPDISSSSLTTQSTKGSDTSGDARPESPPSSTFTRLGASLIVFGNENTSATARSSNNTTSTPSPTATSMLPFFSNPLPLTIQSGPVDRFRPAHSPASSTSDPKQIT